MTESKFIWFVGLYEASYWVPHWRPVAKIKTFGMEPAIINRIESHLTNWRQSVESNGNVANPLPAYSAVAHSSVLRSVLTYINDILNSTPQKYRSGSGDDCIIYSLMSTLDKQASLNRYANHIKVLCVIFSRCQSLSYRPGVAKVTWG